MVKELVALSLKHGIMTPYTSFLADENARRSDLTSNRDQAEERFEHSIVATDGVEGVEQRIAKQHVQQADQPNSSATPYGSPAAASAAARVAVVEPQRGGMASNGGLPQRRRPSVIRRRAADAKDDVRKSCKTCARSAARHSSAAAITGSIPPLARTQENGKARMKVKRFSTEYFELIDKYGHDAAKYLANDEPVTVELDGQVYEID